MADIVMPRLSDTMEEGTILRWLKRDGEEVHRGEELVEIETDKATMSYESDLDGVLHTIAHEGDTLAVGELIARVGPGDPANALAGGEGASANGEGASANDVPRARARGESSPVASATSASASASSPPAPGARIKASPLARRIALERGVELGSLTGSGPGGRIVAADVHGGGARTDVREAGAPAGAGGTGVAGSTGAAGEPAGASAPAPTRPGLADVVTAKGETTTVELTRTQQTIARRMAESKATIPDFTLQCAVDMEACVQLRAELKRLAQPAAPTAPEVPAAEGSLPATAVPTFNDMVVKACALSLREHPRVNASYRDGTLQLHSRVNVGVAVAARDALIVPTVVDADEKSLGEIARETRALAARVRDATITPPELSGGTFTVSNLGMHGVTSFTAIINPPQAAILAVGSVQPRAVVRDGAVLARHTMTLTLVCDHRVLYGADAAQFLARIRELLQAPASLTL